jgi:aspartyl/asparaginyl-tRNA synthetase
MEMRIGRKDYKYATEFMQVDFEKKGATYAEMLDYVSGMVQSLYAHLNDQHGDILQEIRGELLPEISAPLEVYDAAEVKREQGLANDDAVEKWGASQSGGKPFMVVNLKREAYDCFDAEQGKFLNYDVVVPPFGDNPYPIECLSGAERTRSLTDLKRRMTELGYPLEYFAPFYQMFSALDEGDGKITCAGAGFGIERLAAALLGLKDVHDVYPFPRMAEGKIAL